MADKNKTADAGDEDLEGLQLAINEKSDDTLECTRRMREMCAEAKDSGMKTLIALDDQEELIDKFEAAADGINADMALAEKALKVGSCCDTWCTRAASSTRAAQHSFRFLFLPPSQPLQLHHSSRGLQTNPYFCTFVSVFDNLINLLHFDKKDYQTLLLLMF